VRPRALRGRYPGAGRLASGREALRAQAVVVGGREALAGGRVEVDLRTPAGPGVGAAPERAAARGALDRLHRANVLASAADAADDTRMRRLILVLATALAVAAPAHAATFAPPPGKVYTGLSG
jgi:hypothetical protein